MLITDGEVTGSTACGGFTAQVLVANDSIEFKDISPRTMDCSAEAMEQRDLFKKRLMDVRHVEISGET
ncbi:MAG: META domain-containing protein [Pirellulaceae bacterium]